MTECVFCAIACRTIPAFTIYEDDAVIAFMDVNPVNPGHALVIPKSHIENIQDLDEAVYCKVMLTARRIAAAANSVYSPRKIGFAVAGFDVPHAHVHVIPMHDYHDITSKRYLDGTLKQATPAELSHEATRILRAIGLRTQELVEPLMIDDSLKVAD